MARLFLFAIGGTGARVVKALTCLLAAGAKVPGIDTVVPIVMDPHTGNLDLRRAQEMLSRYRDIRREAGSPTSGFFGTEIHSLSQEQPAAGIPDSFLFQLQGAGQTKFRDYLGYGTLDPANQALASMLFSDQTLERDLDIGFVGHPNMGSVVLNQFEESPEFRAFTDSFQAQDAAFIVSSIFGGTGAAGFPIILKNIRNSANFTLRQAKVGAVSIQPYFDVSQPTDGGASAIKSTTFISKTKAALAYYEQALTSANLPRLNALYYVGDEVRNPFPTDPGQGGQQNPAHVVELVAALSVLDFAEGLSGYQTELRGQQAVVKSGTERYREYSLLEAAEQGLNFDHLHTQTLGQVAGPLTQLALLSHYLRQRLPAALRDPKLAWVNEGNPKLDSTFLGTPFFQALNTFDQHFRTWLAEMGGQAFHGFTPFAFTDNLAKLVQGGKYQPKPTGLLWKKEPNLNFVDDFDAQLNKASRGREFVNAPRKFTELMNEATRQLVGEVTTNLPVG